MLANKQALTVKRLKGELKNLEKDREAYYQVVQDPQNNLMFYFLLRGDPASDYKQGYYIGRIELPVDYPSNPGNFYMLTPSGRFMTGQKICLTNSGYHKEQWTPMWNIKNMVIGFVSVFLSDDTQGISHIKETPAERRAKAENSMHYNMTHHRDICMRFDQFVKPDGSLRTDAEISELIGGKKAKKTKVTKTKAEPKAEPDQAIQPVLAPKPLANPLDAPKPLANPLDAPKPLANPLDAPMTQDVHNDFSDPHRSANQKLIDSIRAMTLETHDPAIIRWCENLDN
jgi:ubiquitin-conjugating enzyme E2 J1